jgi:hypothetical protein
MRPIVDRQQGEVKQEMAARRRQTPGNSSRPRRACQLDLVGVQRRGPPAEPRPNGTTRVVGETAPPARLPRSVRRLTGRQGARESFWDASSSLAAGCWQTVPGQSPVTCLVPPAHPAITAKPNLPASRTHSSLRERLRDPGASILHRRLVAPIKPAERGRLG